MKLLVLGDFHGEFPKKFEEIIKKEKIELVVSTGDHFPFHQRKLVFKYCYPKGLALWEVVGKEKYKKIMQRELKEGERVISKLANLNVPAITTVGNIDYSTVYDVFDHKKKGWDFDEQDFFSQVTSKYPKLKRIDYNYFGFGEYIFIGAGGHSFPGKVKSKNFSRYMKKSKELFGRFKRENKEGKVILITHNMPYNTKLDLVGNKAVKSAQGKHYGSKLVRKLIDKYQPIIQVGGHIHEAKGIQKLGRTLCINPGSAHEGHAAIIELEKNKKIKVKLI